MTLLLIRRFFLLQGDVGHTKWWSEIGALGTPLLERSGNNCHVTFLWRDLEGDENTSSTHTVYIEVNCLTEHHTNPQKLTRIVGTDVWCWQTLIPPDWHGTYFFIPITVDNLAPSGPLKNAAINSVKNTDKERNTSKENHRRWWRQILAFATADPLNILSPKHCLWGQNRSLLYLSNVNKHNIWQKWDALTALQFVPKSSAMQSLRTFNWTSSLLQNTRPIWLFETKNSTVELNTEKPLVLLLDGENWAELMPVFSAFQLLTEEYCLTPAIYVFVGNVSKKQRPVDLGCNPLFWQAIHDELYSEIDSWFDGRVSPHQHCVVGQSLGGLAAMYAGLTRPDMFNHVICQSGSFWWPTPLLMNQWMNDEHSTKKRESGWLTTQVLTNGIVNKSVNIVMQIGSQEIRLNALNRHFYQSLVNTGHQVTLMEYCGGHDQVCWREGLIKALQEWLTPVKNLSQKTTVTPSLINNFVTHGTANCGY